MNSKGEIALTLTLIGLFISVVGLSVGVVSVQQQQSRSASADELFTYKSTLELRDENGNVIDWESGMTWNNGLGGATRSSGDIKMPDSSKARLIYDATKSPGVPANVQNVEAHVTIGLPDGWTILDASCENKKGKTCDNVRWGTRDGGTDDHTMYGFKIADGAEVLYWFKVRRPGGTPPTTPDPAQICKSVGQACTDDYPEACTTASGQAGTRTCHKVGTCTGVGNGTQCSWGAGSRCTTCEASGGGGSLSCSRPCIYSQGDKCYKGRCDANNPTCNDGIANANNGCRFAGNECGVPATQVRCSDGGPITSPSPSTPPAPDTLTVHVNYVGTLPKEYTEDIHFHLVISEHKPYTPLFRSGASVWKSGQSKASDTYVKKGLEKGKEYLISLEPGKKGDRTAYYDLTTAKIEGCTNLSHPYGDEVCLYTPGIGSNKVTYTVSPAFQPTLTPTPTIILSGTPSGPPIPSPSPSPGPDASIPPPVSPDGKKRKILLIEYNSRMITKGNKPMFEVYKDRIPNLEKNIAESVAYRNAITYGYFFEIAERIVRTDLPPVDFKEGGYNREAFEKLWDSCIEDGSFMITPCEKLAKLDFNYKKLADEHDICEKVNRGDVDEVWHAIVPNIRLGESDMFGPRPFSINSQYVEVIPECNRNVPTNALNIFYDQGGLHTFFHRIESTLDYVFDVHTPEHNPRSIPRMPVIDYTLTYADYSDNESNYVQLPAYGCGLAHFSPLGTPQDPVGWDNKEASTKSFCKTFRDYPSINTSRADSISCDTWGCTEIGYDLWALSHLPRNPGTDPKDGKLNNWWTYIVEPEIAIRDSNKANLHLSDSNVDYVVNALDYSLLLTKWSNSQLPLEDTPIISAADINQDGSINGLDLSILMLNYGEKLDMPSVAHPEGYSRQINRDAD